MRLEDAIQQGKFSSEKEKLMVNILFTSKWFGYMHNDILKTFGMTQEQYNVLRILRGQKGNPIGVNDISSRMIDKMSNTSRLIDKLVNKGLADRKPCPKDRRAVDVIITNKGMDLLSEMDPIHKDMISQLTSISTNEARELNSLLDKLRSN